MESAESKRLTVIFGSERLFYRKAVIEDAEYDFEMLGDKDFVKYIGGGQTFTLEQITRGIEKEIIKEPAEKSGRWCIIIKKGAEYAGRCGIMPTPDNADTEIFYFIRRKFWGNGYASEAARRLLDYCFEVFKLKRVTAWVYPANAPSIRVIEKLGMNYEGMFDYKGAPVQLRRYGISINEYKKL